MMITQGEDAAFAAEESYGLTKREYFAAVALHGMLACEVDEKSTYQCAGRNGIWAKAVDHADHLIAALND